MASGTNRNARALGHILGPIGVWIFRATMALACFAMFMSIPWMRAPNTADLALPMPPYEVAEGKTLLLRPLGELQEHDVNFLAQAITARLGVPVSILTPASSPSQAYDFSTGSYSAETMLDWLFHERPEGAWHYMGVTTNTLGIHDTQHLYGYANLNEGVSVVSMKHFLTGLRSRDPAAQAKARDQMTRVAIHELTHMLGIGHCRADGCLMNEVKHKDELDADTIVCAKCKLKIASRLARSRHPWQEEMARGDGFFKRGQPALAMDRYLAARRLAPATHSPHQVAGLENRLGATYISQDKPERAEPHLRRALEQLPTLSPALFNQAIIQALLGEEAAAIRTLDRIAETEPLAVATHEYAARFYLHFVQDPGNALVSLRKYAATGGTDAELLKHLRRLEEKQLVVFTPDEVAPITVD